MSTASTWYGSILLVAFSCSLMGEDDGNHPRALGVQGGRFIFGQISDFREDQYLLDTQTGRMWQMTISGTNKEQRLAEIPFDDCRPGDHPEPANIKLDIVLSILNDIPELTSETRKKIIRKTLDVVMSNDNPAHKEAADKKIEPKKVEGLPPLPPLPTH